MRIRQIRQRLPVDIPGDLDTIATVRGAEYLTTTIYVKYNYSENAANNPPNRLESIRSYACPTAFCKIVTTPQLTIQFGWPGAMPPSRGEAFRVRISLAALKEKANWRVQTVAANPAQPFTWDE